MAVSVPTSVFRFPIQCFPIVITLLDMRTRREVWKNEIPDPAPAVVRFPSVAECNDGHPVIVIIETADGASQQFPPKGMLQMLPD